MPPSVKRRGWVSDEGRAVGSGRRRGPRHRTGPEDEGPVRARQERVHILVGPKRLVNNDLTIVPGRGRPTRRGRDPYDGSRPRFSLDFGRASLRRGGDVYLLGSGGSSISTGSLGGSSV